MTLDGVHGFDSRAGLRVASYRRDTMNPIDESDRCGECGQLPELIEETAVNPLSGDEWDRYKCDCGHTTVRVPA